MLGELDCPMAGGDVKRRKEFPLPPGESDPSRERENEGEEGEEGSPEGEGTLAWRSLLEAWVLREVLSPVLRLRRSVAALVWVCSTLVQRDDKTCG